MPGVGAPCSPCDVPNPARAVDHRPSNNSVQWPPGPVDPPPDPRPPSPTPDARWLRSSSSFQRATKSVAATPRQQRHLTAHSASYQATVGRPRAGAEGAGSADASHTVDGAPRGARREHHKRPPEPATGGAAPGPPYRNLPVRAYRRALLGITLADTRRGSLSPAAGAGSTRSPTAQYPLTTCLPTAQYPLTNRSPLWYGCGTAGHDKGLSRSRRGPPGGRKEHYSAGPDNTLENPQENQRAPGHRHPYKQG